jgi:hypothetical protein
MACSLPAIGDRSSGALPDPSGQEKDYTALVTEIYQKHNPEKLGDPDFVARALRKYAGKEEWLVEALRKKYQPSDENKRASVNKSKSVRDRGGKHVGASKQAAEARKGRKRPKGGRMPVYYKYVVMPGNNSRMIIQTFRSRPWWGPTKPEADNFNTLWEPYRRPSRYATLKPDSGARRSINHLEHNACLVTKQGLLVSMKRYYEANGRDVFTCMPVSYLLSGNGGVDEFDQFEKHFKRIECEAGTEKAGKKEKEEKKDKKDKKGKKAHRKSNNNQKAGNLWILKPASNSNRGSNIEVVDSIEGVRQCIGQDRKQNMDKHKAWIVQKYIEDPLLIDGRKFDIRCLVLVHTSPDRTYKVYFWKNSYVRTSSKAYSTNDLSDRQAHLTNDAVQIKGGGYGKFEPGNKLTLSDFSDYLDERDDCREEGALYEHVIPRMKAIIGETIHATKHEINTNEHAFCFEQFGYDFMLSDTLEVSLLEVNSNPCLEFSSPFLEATLPTMIEEVFQKALDPMFPPRNAKHRKLAAAFPALDNFELVAEVPWAEDPAPADVVLGGE